MNRSFNYSIIQNSDSAARAGSSNPVYFDRENGVNQGQSAGPDGQNNFDGFGGYFDRDNGLNQGMKLNHLISFAICSTKHRFHMVCILIHLNSK